MAVTAQALRDGAQQAALGAGDSEVERRSASSRAYYAAFHRCQPIARAHPVFVDTGSHKRVIEAMTKSANRQIQSIGWRLEQCRAKRVKADYHLADDFTLAETELVSAQCDKIWASANSLGAAFQLP